MTELSWGEIERGGWDDAPLYIVGGGDSLHGFDFSRLYGKGRILGLNRSATKRDAATGELHVRCDAFLTVDHNFARQARDEIVAFGGDKYLALPENFDLAEWGIAGATYVKRGRHDLLSSNPAILTGPHTGFGALNLAWLKGPKTHPIYLLGYDFTWGRERTHWHGGYTWHGRNSQRHMARWAPGMAQAARQLKEAGFTVINANPDSGLTCFPFCRLEEL